MFSRAALNVALCASLRMARPSARLLVPAVATRGFHRSRLVRNEYSEQLASVLKAESDFEKKDTFGLDESYQKFLDETGFKIVGGNKKVLAELVREGPAETVYVYFDVLRITQATYDLRQYQEEAAKDEELAQSAADIEGMAYTDVNVVVEKDGKAVGFDLSLSLVNHDFAVTGITNFDSAAVATSDSADAAAERDLLYSGPAFNNLATELQDSVEQYLQSRTIDAALGEFILAYSSVKENAEYIDWLDELQGFFK